MAERKDIRSILVIKLRNIGDVLLSSPLFANLRLHYPQARICALVNSGTEPMLTENPDIDRIFVYDRAVKKGPLLKRMSAELRLLASLRGERFDLALNLTEGDRGALAALVSGADTRVGIDAIGRGFRGKNSIFSSILPPPAADMHTVEGDLRMLEPLGLPALHKKVSFHYGAADGDSAVSRLANVGLAPGKYFLAHITSRWMFKTMPPATAAHLLDLLCERSGLPCLITASPERKEHDYLAKVMQHIRRQPPVMSGLSLKELGALAAMARFFAGVDSAPMHMAAALDVPVLGVFGPSTAQVWGPWDNHLSGNPYTAARGIQHSSLHTVLQSDRDCVPCHRDGCNGSKISDCLAFGETVLEATVMAFIDRLSASTSAEDQTRQLTAKAR